MSSAKTIRISPEFEELLQTVKKEHKSARLSDPQATAIITEDYWKLKINKNKKDGVRFI